MIKSFSPGRFPETILLIFGLIIVESMKNNWIVIGLKLWIFTRNNSAVQFLACYSWYHISSSIPSKVFLVKVVLKMCSKFIGKHRYRSVISIKLLYKKLNLVLNKETNWLTDKQYTYLSFSKSHGNNLRHLRFHTDLCSFCCAICLCFCFKS